MICGTTEWLFEFDKSFLHVVKQRLYDQAKQDLHRILDDSSKCRKYKYVICKVELQFYLQKGIPVMLSR